MVNLKVIPHLLIALKRGWAQNALYLSGVQFHMVVHSAPLSECSAAVWALVSLYVRMNFHMFCQYPPSVEDFWAYCAYEVGALNIFMFFKFALILENLTTFRAAVCSSFLTGFILNMKYSTRFVPEPFRTEVTRVSFLLEVHTSVVLLHQSFRRKRFPTCCTFVSISLMNLKVLVVIRFIREKFWAGLAQEPLDRVAFQMNVYAWHWLEYFLTDGAFRQVISTVQPHMSSPIVLPRKGLTA